MKNLIIQSLACLLIFALTSGLTHLLIDVIGWLYLYVFVAGYLVFIIITSRYNWIITSLQFLIVGFLSFMIIGSLYNEVYEPYVEQNYRHYEGQISTTIGLIELILIKLLSDLILSKVGLEKKKSKIEKILLPTTS